MEKLEKIRSNLETQLSELESLQSVFYNPGEIRIEDPQTLSDIKAFVDSKTDSLPQYLDYTVNLAVENLKFEMCVTLTHDYPHVEPEIFVRNHKLNRRQHVELNRELVKYIAGLEKGEASIFSAVSWLQDNAERYVDVKEEICTKKEEGDTNCVRYWIYSHHIYSKTKRREIVDLGNRLHIGGFCMPGKPGIICIEGKASDCDEWWQLIKSMPWKKIFVKVTENDDEKNNSFLKFNNFEEIVFQNSGPKFNHMDMGELFRYLEDKNLGYIFKELFGVEAKSNKDE